MDQKKKKLRKRKQIDGIRKYNILNILKNVSPVVTGLYLHYKNVPKKIMFARGIAERTK